MPARPVRCLAIVPAAILLSLTPRVTAAGCPALDYRAGLAAAAAALGQIPPDVATAQREVAGLRRQDPASAAALRQVFDDLGSSPPALDDARRRLDSMSTVLAYPPGSVCDGGDQAARAALRTVYASPDLRHLDDSAQPALLASIVAALARLIGRAAGIVGPLGLALLALALVGVPLLVALRRWLRTPAGLGARVLEPADAGDDPGVEWNRAERAAAGGDHREAVRRAFRAALLEVALRGRLHLDAAWTTRELLQRCDAEGDVLASLAAAAALFERAWYSRMPVTEDDWLRARDRCAAVRRLAATARGAPR